MNNNAILKILLICAINIPYLSSQNIETNGQYKLLLVDSLERQLSETSDSDRLDALISLSKANWNLSPQKGMIYSNEAIKLAENLGEIKKKAKALLYGGVNAWYMSDYEKAIEYYEESLEIAERMQDRRLSAFNLNNLGMVSSQIGNNEIALKYYTKSSQIMKEFGDEIEYAKIINNIGKLKLILGNFDEALENHLSILHTIEESNEKQFLIWLLNDIGNVYKKMNDHAKAIEYFNKSLKVSNEIDDIIGKSKILNNLGMISMEQNEYEKADKYFHNGLQLALQSGAKEEIKENYLNLSEYYLKIGNLKKSLENYKQYKIYSDSILNEVKLNKIIEMQTKYETERKEKELEVQKFKLAQKDAEIKQQRILQIALLLGFVIITVFVILVVTAYLRIKRANKKIIELDVFKQGMIGMIVHDLKNPLNLILNMDELTRIKQAGRQMLNMVLNILDVQKFEDAKIDLTIRNHSLDKIASNAVNHVDFLAQQKSIKMTKAISPQINVKVDEEMIERVFVNLLTNGIKYTPTNGSITLSADSGYKKSKAGLVRVEVSDTGEGIPSNQLDQIFDKFGQVKAISSGRIRSTGMGLTFCKFAVEAHRGEIGIQSKPGKGTTFFFTLPGKADTIKPDVIQPQKNDDDLQLRLTKSEKAELKPYIKRLEVLMVYETSEIKTILEEIETMENTNLDKWKKELRQTLYSMNEKKYFRLLSIAKMKES